MALSEGKLAELVPHCQKKTEILKKIVTPLLRTRATESKIGFAKINFLTVAPGDSGNRRRGYLLVVESSPLGIEFALINES